MLPALDYLLRLPWVKPLGWTLVHFLWQGGLAGLGAWLLLHLEQRASAGVRYWTGLAALAACVVFPVATFIVIARPFSTPVQRIVVLGNARDVSEPSLENHPDTQAQSFPSAQRTVASTSVTSRPTQALSARPATLWQESGGTLIRWLVPLWLCGVLVLAIRLLMAWTRVQCWRRSAEKPEADWIEASVRKLARQLRVTRSVRFLISSAVPGPVAMGAFVPAILFPAQLLSGLPREYIEAVIAHELAHIRRNDYLVNLLQSVVEIVLFYHPVVWWLNREIRQAREECCDALVLESGQGKETYARALVSLAEIPAFGDAVPSATGASLLTRVLRIVGQRPSRPMISGQNAAWAFGLVCVFLAAWGILHSANLTGEEQPVIANSKNPPHGIVVDDLGQPVPGARVILYRMKSTFGLGNGVIATATTDEGGRFALDRRLEFEVPNGTSVSDHYVLFAVAPAKALGWRVIVGGTPDEKDCRLTLTKPVTQSYEVVDKAGRPVAGAGIYLRYAGAQEDRLPLFAEAFSVTDDIGICSAVTDAAGRATLSNLPDTCYSVVAAKPGFETSLSCTTPRDGTPKFTMVPAATLEGRVIDPLGRPVEGAVVWLFPKFKYWQFFLARTDSDGRYRVDGIWSNGTTPDWGKYQVGIRHPKFTAKTREVAFSSGQSITGFDIAAVPGVEVVGRLLDPGTQQPVAGGRVYIDSESGRQDLKSGPDGSFRCRVVSGDAYIFSGEPPGGHYYVEDRESPYPSRISTHPFGDEFEVTLYLGGVMGKLGNLSGSVIASDGHPATLSPVKAASISGRMQLSSYYGGGWLGPFEGGTYTDAAGAFSFPDVPVGVPFVVMAADREGGEAGIARGLMTPPALDLKPPILLHPATAVSFAIADFHGKPRPNLSVSVTPVIDGVAVDNRRQKLQTDQAGMLRVSAVIPGILYRVGVAGSQTDYAEVRLADADGHAISGPLALSDNYFIRLKDANGRSYRIKSFKEYSVWIKGSGDSAPMRWSNGPLQIERRDNMVVIPRKTLILGKPGDKMDVVVETESGLLARASGNLPLDGATPLVLKITEPLVPKDSVPDRSIPDIEAGEIAGRVLDPQGHPVAGAKIMDGAGRNGQPGVQSDASGIFRMQTQEGRTPVYLTISKEGCAPLFLTDIPVGGGFAVTLQNNTRLRGTVGGGNPGKVSILLEKDKPTSRENMGFLIRGIQYRTGTGPDGSYDFPMEPGAYRFQLRSGDGRFQNGEVTVNSGETVSLPGGLEKGDDVTLQLIDRQTGKPVPGVDAEIMDHTDAYMMSSRPKSERTSDASGLLHWENVMPGKTDFQSWRMFQSLGADKPQLPWVRWWREDEPEEWRRIRAMPPTRGQGVGSIYVDVTSGMKPVRVLMERGVKLSGVVTGPDGKPLAGIRVGLVPNYGVRSTLTGDMRFTPITSEKGEFSEYIPAGNGIVYNLCAFSWPTDQPAPAASAVSESFSSKPGDELAFKLKMEKGGWISGRAVDAAGKPVPGARLIAGNTDNRDVPYADRVAKAGPDGAFRIGPLRAGTYVIRPTCDGLNIADTPGFTPPSVQIADGEEKKITGLVLPSNPAP